MARWNGETCSVVASRFLPAAGIACPYAVSLGPKEMVGMGDSHAERRCACSYLCLAPQCRVQKKGERRTSDFRSDELAWFYPFVLDIWMLEASFSWWDHESGVCSLPILTGGILHIDFYQAILRYGQYWQLIHSWHHSYLASIALDSRLYGVQNWDTGIFLCIHIRYDIIFKNKLSYMSSE